MAHSLGILNVLNFIVIVIQWYVGVLSICLVTNEVEYLFMYLLTIHRTSFVRCLFKCIPHLKKTLIVSLLTVEL